MNRYGIIWALSLVMMAAMPMETPGNAAGDFQAASAASRGETDGELLYLGACRKTSSLPDLAADVNLTLSLGDSGHPLNLSSDIHMVYEDKDSSSIKYQVKTDTRVLNSSLSLYKEIFYWDGFYYYNLAGAKIKKKASPEDVRKEIEGNPVTSPFDSNYLGDFQVNRGDDGTLGVSFTVKTEDIQDEIRSIYNMFGINAMLNDVVFGDMMDTVIISPEGYCLREDVFMTVVQTVQGKRTEGNITIRVVYPGPGRKETVTVPSPEEYREPDGISR